MGTRYCIVRALIPYGYRRIPAATSASANGKRQRASTIRGPRRQITNTATRKQMKEPELNPRAPPTGYEKTAPVLIVKNQATSVSTLSNGGKAPAQSWWK